MGHQVVTKVITNMYAQLRITTRREPKGLLDGQQRPADLLVIPAVACNGGAGTAALPVALDIGITEPGQDRAVRLGSWRVPTGALKSANDYTKAKRDKYAPAMERNPGLNFTYRPIVFETTSARGEEAEKWWQEITHMAKDKEGAFGLGFGGLMEYNGLAHAWSGQSFARHWGIRLSLALMQATHRNGMGRVSEYIMLHGRQRQFNA